MHHWPRSCFRKDGAAKHPSDVLLDNATLAWRMRQMLAKWKHICVAVLLCKLQVIRLLHKRSMVSSIYCIHNSWWNMMTWWHAPCRIQECHVHWSLPESLKITTLDPIQSGAGRFTDSTFLKLVVDMANFIEFQHWRDNQLISTHGNFWGFHNMVPLCFTIFYWS